MNTIKYLLFTLVSLVWSVNVSAGSWNTNDKIVVLDGHDVVAYHTMYSTAVTNWKTLENK